MLQKYEIMSFKKITNGSDMALHAVMIFALCFINP